MLAGEVISQVYESNRTYDLTLKVNDDSRNTSKRISEMIIDANGRKIPLLNVAEITSVMGPNTINRENVSRKIVVSANISGGDLRGVVNKIQHIIENEIQLPEEIGRASCRERV